MTERCQEACERERSQQMVSISFLLYHLINMSNVKDAATQEILADYSAFIDAHNLRQWSLHNEPWCSMLPSLKFEITYGKKVFVDIPEYLEMAKVAYSDPSRMTEIRDIDIEVNLKSGQADCYVNLEVKTSEVVRHGVGIAKYELRERHWECVSYKHIKGVDVSGL